LSKKGLKIESIWEKGKSIVFRERKNIIERKKGEKKERHLSFEFDIELETCE